MENMVNFICLYKANHETVNFMRTGTVGLYLASYSIIYSFIQQIFIKYLPCANVLGNGDTSINKIDKNLSPLEHTFQ